MEQLKCRIGVCITHPTNWKALNKILVGIYGESNVHEYALNGIINGGCPMYRIYCIKDKIVAFVRYDNIVQKSECTYHVSHIHPEVDIVFALLNMSSDLYGIDIKHNKKCYIKQCI